MSPKSTTPGHANVPGVQETETNYLQGITELTSAPLSLTLFLGGATNTTPTEVIQLEWDTLEATLRELTVPGPKGSAGYVVAGVVEGNRCEDNTGPATMLVVDYEPPGAADWDHWPCSFVAHTSDSHLRITKSNPTGGERWRVFLRLDAEIPADRYKKARRAIDPRLPAGSKVRGRSQPAFLPTREDTEYRVGDAGPLDWRALLPAPGASVDALVVAGAREVGPAPDPALVARLLDQWVSVWPTTDRHACSFALGGLLARGSWPDEVCIAFAEQLLYRTDSDVEDGLACVELSLENAADGEVYGIPTLVNLLRLPAGAPPGVPPATRLQAFLEGFVDAMVIPDPPSAVRPTAVTYEGDAPPDPREEDLLTWGQHLKTHPKTGKHLANSYNAAHTLKYHPVWKGVFAWDEFASKVVITKPLPAGKGAVGDYWSPDNGGAFAVQEWFTAKGFDELGKTLIIDAIHNEAVKSCFHPVRKYLDELPLWDGVDRNLAAYFGAEQTDYHRAVCGAWLRSAVARVMQPGCQADSILVLEGRQGARKSTALRYLCPDVRHFLVVRSDIRSKDFLSNMRGRWIAEFAEVDKLIGSRDASELKDILSTTIDTYRKAYGVDDLSYPRQIVFAGTTNPDENGYLKDSTGNRRYWVVLCGELIDTNAILRDRDQIWAQAYSEYLLGTPWWLDRELEEVAAVEAAERLESDDWEEVIERHRAELTSRENGFTTLEALGKLSGALPEAQIDQRHTRRMAKVLRKLGFRIKDTKLEGQRIKRWVSDPGGIPLV